MAAAFAVRHILMKPVSPLYRTMSTAINKETATFANGCFWGTEHIFKKHFAGKGLLNAEVGYIGGDTTKFPNPTYQQVCSGKTGYAEAAQLVFDPVC